MKVLAHLLKGYPCISFTKNDRLTINTTNQPKESEVSLSLQGSQATIILYPKRRLPWLLMAKFSFRNPNTQRRGYKATVFLVTLIQTIFPQTRVKPLMYTAEQNVGIDARD